MNPQFLALKAARATFNASIRKGDLEAVHEILDRGISVGRNQMELAIRCVASRESAVPLENRFAIFDVLYQSIRRNADLLERASRYVECTLITLGHHNNPLRTELMNKMGIVPGVAAGRHYGKHPEVNSRLTL